MDLNLTDPIHRSGRISEPRRTKEVNDMQFGVGCFGPRTDAIAIAGAGHCEVEMDLPALDEEDRCTLFLGLGPTPSFYCNITSSPVEVAREPSDVDLCQYLDGQVDSGILQLGLASGTAEPAVGSELGHVNPASTQSRSNHFPWGSPSASSIDEGSTSAKRSLGGYLHDPGSGHHHLQFSPEHSASADCSMSIGVVSDFKAADTANDSRRHHHHHQPKKCRFRGCCKGARGASGLCIAHGGGQRCQRPGCNKGAESRTAFCKAHGGGRRCQELGCTKSAEGKTDFCIAHGGGRRCGREGCTKAARGKSGLCIRHGGGKRCRVEGCKRSAEGQVGLCISHGGGRRCQYPGCSKGAQGSTIYCKAHGGGKRCAFEGCTKGAEGSTPLCKGHGGGKRCLYNGGGVCPKSVHGGTNYCVAHGGGKRCSVPGCTKSARGRTDCCVRHGGGKRCKAEGCGKSAQGSTDFCKAHGGGKRCGWAQGCDKFARGRSGLCASHGTMAAAGKNGNSIIPGLFHGNDHNNNNSTSEITASSEINTMVGTPLLLPHTLPSSMSWLSPGKRRARMGEEEKSSPRLAVPEGRVHGGGLLSLLGGSFQNVDVDVGDVSS